MKLKSSYPAVVVFFIVGVLIGLLPYNLTLGRYQISFAWFLPMPIFGLLLFFVFKKIQLNDTEVSKTTLTPRIEIPIKTNAREFVVGLFIWLIYCNLVFLMDLYLFLFVLVNFRYMGISLIAFILLPTILVSIALFTNKRIWGGVGIITAIIISMASWLTLVNYLFAHSAW